MKLTNMLCLLVAVSLSGCSIGPGGICGPQTPIYYCQSKADQEKMRPKPYGAHWVKEGMTREGRRSDLMACGAVGGQEDVRFKEEQIEATRQAGDPNTINAYLRLRELLGQCMSARGYQPVGDLKYLGGCDARCMYP